MMAVWGGKGLSVVLFERKLAGVLFLHAGYRQCLVVILLNRDWGRDQ